MRMTTWRWLVLAILATSLLSSCRRMPWSTKLTGTVQANGSQGSYRLTLTECKNGQHDGFFGVWLRDRQNPRQLLRIAKSPESGALVISTSDGGPLQLARDCRFSSQVLRDHLINSATCVRPIRNYVAVLRPT